MISQSNIFEVYQEGGALFTRNLVPGKKVYNERIVFQDGTEYRQWDPEKSKLGAAILKGALNVGIRKGDIVLYLGCSTGTTPSHVSDMIGSEGFLFGMDVAPRVLREFVFLCQERPNMTALLEDANHPEQFSSKICQVDIVYQDVAQRNQAEIFLKNCKAFLKDDGYGLLAVKAKSINVAAKPREIFRQVRELLAKELIIVDERTLDPYEKDHCFFVCKKGKLP